MATEVARAGGLTLISDPAIDEKMSAIEPPVNPHRVVNEPGSLPLRDPEWILDSAKRGGVVKILQRNLPRLATHPEVCLRVCVMRRSSAEIRESSRRTFGHEPPSAIFAYSLSFDRLVRNWEQRTDVASVLVVNYVDVVADPGIFIDSLIDHGWGIRDPAAALSVPDPIWYRNRLNPSIPRHTEQLGFDTRRTTHSPV